jgi:competence protein ComEA
MLQPLKNNANSEPVVNALPQNLPALNAGVESKPQNTSPSVWKPVITRVVLSGLALVGLAGVGAASMLAGLDGARANSPRVVATQSLASAAKSTLPPASSVDSDAGSSSFTAPNASGGGPAPAPVNPTCSGRTADGRVILNLATVADLRTLPGIGEKRANAILALRDKLKRFHKLQELRRVRGIGAKTLQRLAPKLLVDPPAGECAVAGRE